MNYGSKNSDMTILLVMGSIGFLFNGWSGFFGAIVLTVGFGFFLLAAFWGFVILKVWLDE